MNRIQTPIPTARSLRDATDDALAAALATNPSAAVGEMHRRFARKLRGLAVSLVGASDADDVVQDVFVVVLSEARFHPAPNRLAAWLAGVVRRVANARRVQVHMEQPRAADAMICDPWLEEIDGPEPQDESDKRGKSARGSP